MKIGLLPSSGDAEVTRAKKAHRKLRELVRVTEEHLKEMKGFILELELRTEDSKAKKHWDH